MLHLRRAPNSPSLLACSLLASTRAGAQEVVVRGDPVAAALRERERSLFTASGVDLREEASAASVAASLEGVPGVHPRSTGDPLSNTALSVRGAAASQVLVALDGVLLNDAVSEGVDLSILPPALLERAEVYRGAAPLRLGAGGLGGAVELFTRTPSGRPLVTAGGGVGSFLQRRIYGLLSGASGPWRVLGAVSYRATEGDFTYFDDNGTPYNPTDNRTSTRVNNRASAGDLLLRACLAREPEACVMAYGSARVRGLPGPGGQQLDGPWSGSQRFLVRASVAHGRPQRDRTQWYVAAQGRGDRYVDPTGLVVGQPVDANAAGFSGEAGFLGTYVAGPVSLEPVGRVRVETVHTLATLGNAVEAQRVDSLLGADAMLDLGTLRIGAGLGLSGVLDRATGSGVGTLTRTLPLWRLSARTPASWPLWGRVQLASNARSPTLVELFGLGDLVLPSPGLRPERTLGVEAALGGELRRQGHALSGEVLGFTRSATDQLAWVRTSPVGQRALNLDSVAITGLEAWARYRWRQHLSVTASYTLTDARILSRGSSAEGRQVPQVPMHDLSARVGVGSSWLQLWTSLTLLTGMYFDVDNLLGAPNRYQWDAGVQLSPSWLRGVTLSVQASNLLDQRSGLVHPAGTPERFGVRESIADYVGYPLPGRSIFVALGTQLEGER